jgi:antitoxin CptB
MTTDGARGELAQLRWRCRRGMKELDLLLSRYVEEQFCAAPIEYQRAFRALLDAPDPVIYAYCLQQERPPSAILASLIERIVERPRAAGPTSDP